MHAHPDDESINNGATMAKYAAEGAQVTLVTCTLGEEGEVIPPELAHLARRPGRRPRRAPDRRARRRDGGAGRHRPPLPRRPGPLPRLRDDGRRRRTTAPAASGRRTVDEAAGYLVEVIREVRPQVLVTYDANGGYGHPDHIQAHRVAMRAAELAADPATGRELGEPHAIAKIYWNRVPRSVAEEAFARLRAAAPRLPFAGHRRHRRRTGRGGRRRRSPPRSTAPRTPAAKAAAMRAHATQIAVDGPFFALSNDLASRCSPPSTTSWCAASPGRRHGRRAGTRSVRRWGRS